MLDPAILICLPARVMDQVRLQIGCDVPKLFGARRYP